ncbi:hypothetical protein Tco_1347933, partial [Tanacetum coccineum]
MQRDDGIFISQDKYVVDLLKKFDFVTIKTASTPIETHKALLKDEEVEDMDVYLYRLMIGSLMCLTASRPDIMLDVCACTRFQVTPKVLHLHAVNRIFRYSKGQPKLGLWYPRDSPFDLEAFSDSDYAGASLDRKSTTGCCQFLGKRLISWQCKEQTVVANSTTKAEYVVVANCYGQVVWIQNQMLDYGFNFINTRIYIDNESTTCIVKNPVFHSKTKHIEIRHHFIRYSYEKKLIQVIKIHTDHNVADLLINAFDVSSGPIYLVVDETVIKEWEDRMKRAATTASSLEAEQDSEAQITFEAASKQSNDPHLSRVNTLESGEDNMKLKELMEFFYAARDSLTAVRHKLMLPGITYYCWHLEGGVKFLMYPRFVQVFLDKQVEGMSKHKGVYVTPFHTKKVFANMKRPCKGFSGRVTPLFPTMMIQASEDMDSGPTEPVTDAAHVSTPSYDLPQSGEDSMQLSELMNLCTSLQEKVLDLEKAKTARAKEIASLKKRFKQLEKRRKLRTPGFKRLRKVGSTSRVESSNDVNLGAQEDASKQGRKIADLDTNVEVTLVDETQEKNEDNLMFD